jgi:hypothetical protein
VTFLTGAQEAAAFENRNFVALHQSTLRKVDIVANILGRAHNRALKTNTTWWEMHGGHIRSISTWIIEHKLIAFIAASIAGLIIAVVELRH